MIVVALVVVMAVVALVVVVAALIGRDGADDGFATVGVVLAIVVIAVVVLAAGFVVGGGDGEPGGDATPSAPVVVPGGGAAPLRPPQLVLTATAEGQLPRPLGAMGDIVDGEVLVVGVAGLEPGSRATVHQCPTGASAPSACRAGLAFQVGPQGERRCSWTSRRTSRWRAVTTSTALATTAASSCSVRLASRPRPCSAGLRHRR